MSTPKKRLDLLLVEQGLAATRQKAQALIMAGAVLVNGQRADKPGTPVVQDAQVRILEREPYVGRGGVKLAQALDELGLPVQGLVAVDVGASTGGFTDCLLQQGAARVYALDVGYGQLDLRLRQDPRVVVMERVNAHYPFSLPEPVDLATVDVSFISLEKVLPNVLEHLKPGGRVLALVKPQFEAPRGAAKKGVVKDPQVRAQVLGRIIVWAIERGLRLRGLTASPLLGAQGNREFFLLLESPPL